MKLIYLILIVLSCLFPEKVAIAVNADCLIAAVRNYDVCGYMLNAWNNKSKKAPSFEQTMNCFRRADQLYKICKKSK